MARQAAKQWSRGLAIQALEAINLEMIGVIKGQKTPQEAITNIEKKLLLLKGTTATKRVSDGKPLDARLPSVLRKQLEGAIHHNERAIIALKAWQAPERVRRVKEIVEE